VVTQINASQVIVNVLNLPVQLTHESAKFLRNTHFELPSVQCSQIKALSVVKIYHRCFDIITWIINHREKRE